MKFLAGLVLAVVCGAQAQFEILDGKTTASLRGIDAVSPQVAWASGSGGTVLLTTDGGKNWKHCAVPPGGEKLDFRGVQGFDATTAIAMSSGKGDLSRLYKTGNGCETWKLVFTNPDADGFWDAMRFYDPPSNLRGNQGDLIGFTGLVVGDPVDGSFAIFKTIDGGKTWTRRLPRERVGGDCKIDGVPAALGETLFAASNQSLVNFGGIPNFLLVSGGKTARLSYTDLFSWDGSLCHLSTHKIVLPLAHGNASSGAFAIAAMDEQSYFPLRLMIVGGDYAKPEQTTGNAVFVASKDGFHVPFTSYFNVSTPQKPPNGYRSAVAYDVAAKTWITVGPNGSDISKDDGKNWTPLKPSAQDAPDADKNWNAISLPFVVGSNGKIGRLNPGILRE